MTSFRMEAHRRTQVTVSLLWRSRRSTLWTVYPVMPEGTVRVRRSQRVLGEVLTPQAGSSMG